MLKTKGYAVQSAESKLEPFEFERREVNAKDVLLKLCIAEFVIRTFTKRITTGEIRFIRWCRVTKSSGE